MSDTRSPPQGSNATIAIYDRPPWWRRRRTWLIALPVAVALAASAVMLWLA